KAAVRKAVELDDSLVRAHSAMAQMLMQYDWNWSGAEKELKRAIELDPNSADAHADYASYLHLFLRGDEAQKELNLAQELDPEHNRFGGYNIERNGLEQERRSVDEKASQDALEHGRLAKGYLLAGKYKEAVELGEKCMSLYGYKDLAEVLQSGYEKADYQGALRE